MNKKYFLILVVLALVAGLVTSCDKTGYAGNEITESVTKAADALKVASQSMADSSKEDLQKAQAELEKLRIEVAQMKAESEKAAVEAQAAYEKAVLEAQAALEKSRNEARIAKLEAEKAKAEVGKAQAEVEKAQAEAQSAKIAAAAAVANAKDSKAKQSTPVMELSMTTKKDVETAVEAANASQTEVITSAVDAKASEVKAVVDGYSITLLKSLDDNTSSIEAKIDTAVETANASQTEALTGAVEAKASEVKAAVDGYSETVINAADVITSSIETKIDSAVQTVNDSQTEVIISAVDAKASEVKAAVDAGTSAIEAKIDEVAAAANSIDMSACSTKVVEDVSSVVTDKAFGIQKTIYALSESVLTGSEVIVDRTQTKITEAKDEILSAIGNVTDNVASAADSYTAKVSADTLAAIATATAHISEAEERVQTAFENATLAAASISDTVVAAENNIRDSARIAVDSAVETVNSATDKAVVSAVDKINEAMNQAVEAGNEKLIEAFKALLEEMEAEKIRKAEEEKKATEEKKVAEKQPLKIRNLSLEAFMAEREQEEARRAEIIAANKAAAEAAAKAAAEKAAETPEVVTISPDQLRFRTEVTDNDNRVVEVGSSLYSNIQSLFIALGMAQPSSTGPWTVAELKDMMSLVNEQTITKENVKNLYSRIMAELESKVTFDFGYIKLNPQNFDISFGVYGLYQGYGDKESNLSQASVRYSSMFNERYPLLSTGFEVYVGENAYGRFTLSLKDANLSKLYSQPWTTNFNCVLNKEFRVSMLDYSFFTSYGLGGFSFILGNDYLSWGGYDLGSMTLSPETKLGFAQASYHDRSSKFTFTQAVSGTHWVSAAKAEYSISRKYNVSASAVNAYESIWDIAENPVFALDINAEVVKGFNLYAQAAATTSVEFCKGYGLLLGGKWVIPAKYGVLSLTGELSYMAKGLYADSFYFEENATTSFNNPTMLILAPGFVEDNYASKDRDAVNGARNNSNTSFASFSGVIKYQTPKFETTADWKACLELDSFGFTDKGVNKEVYRAFTQLKIDTEADLMPGIGVFGGINFQFATFFDKGSFIPKYKIIGTNRTMDGFAGFKISL